MAFAELLKGLKVEPGATDRYRLLTALERMLDGKLYDDLEFGYDQEYDTSDEYVPTRRRRPSLQYNLAHLLFATTQGELFGDEQFPTIHAFAKRERVPNAEAALADLGDLIGLDILMPQIYEEGQPGSCAIILRTTPSKAPWFEILPGRFCEPVYLPTDPSTIHALKVTYPIGKEQIQALYSAEEITERGLDQEDTAWFRYVIDAKKETRYHPLPANEFERLGEKREDGTTIEFVARETVEHSVGRLPAIYVKNLIGKQRSIDGPATWFPIVDMIIGMDYGLSQTDRGLRYSADPMLFVKRGDLISAAVVPAGDEGMGSETAELKDGKGRMVRSAAQVLVGGKDGDAKLVEMTGSGIKELREFAKQLREWAIEVVGGEKSDAAHSKGVQSGSAIKQLRKPMQLLIGRQRRAYGDGCIIPIIELTLHAIRAGVVEIDGFDISEVPDQLRLKLDWPSDEQLLGQDLLYTVQALEMAAGGTQLAPLQLLQGDAVSKKLASELGMADPGQMVENPKPLLPPDGGNAGGPPDGGPKE